MTEASRYVITPPPQAALAVAGTDKLFPVRRIWCVGRNYIEHIREMGQDERAPPFFFAKPADAIVPDGGTVPYPSLTKDMHHEVELVVALKSGGRNIPVDKANDCIYGYGVGIDLTRRDLQFASREIKRPWEVGKAFDHSAPCGALKPASEIGHPAKGEITYLVVRGRGPFGGGREIPEQGGDDIQQIALVRGDPGGGEVDRLQHHRGEQPPQLHERRRGPRQGRRPAREPGDTLALLKARQVGRVQV